MTTQDQSSLSWKTISPTKSSKDSKKQIYSKYIIPSSNKKQLQ